MKKLLVFALLMLAVTAYADYDLTNVSGWEIEGPSRNCRPFLLELSGDWIGDSKFTKDSVEGDHLRFGIWEAEVEAVAYCNSCYGEGANLAISFTQSRLDWECNPFFDKRTFNTANFSLLVYTQRFNTMTWVGQLTYNIDANNWGFVDYSSYDWFLWGRKAYSDCFGLHLGIFGQSGLRLPLVLPIVGFDWQMQQDWKLSLIFPVNLSLLYTWDGCWTFGLRGRCWCDRHRVGEHAHLSKAVFRYLNYGLETVTLYRLCDWLHLDIHAGYAFGGRVKVAHRRGRESHTLRFRPAAYVGGELTANF